MTEDEVFKMIISPSLERATNEMPGVQFRSLDSGQTLYGRAGAILDSLNLVTFVFIIEEEFERVTGKSLKVTTQDVLTTENPPFANLQSLTTFLAAKERL